MHVGGGKPAHLVGVDVQSAPPPVGLLTNKQANTHTHTHIYIYILYMHERSHGHDQFTARSVASSETREKKRVKSQKARVRTYTPSHANAVSGANVQLLRVHWLQKKTAPSAAPVNTLACWITRETMEERGSKRERKRDGQIDR